jgi:hypothetical protein
MRKSGQAKKKFLFVNKKKRKNSGRLGRAGSRAPGPEKQKFLRRFFKKQPLPSLGILASGENV